MARVFHVVPLPPSILESAKPRKNNAMIVPSDGCQYLFFNANSLLKYRVIISLHISYVLWNIDYNMNYWHHTPKPQILKHVIIIKFNTMYTYELEATTQ